MSWIANSARPTAELAQRAVGTEIQSGSARLSGSSGPPLWANAGDAIFGIAGAGGGAQSPAFDGVGASNGGLGGAMGGFFGLVGNLFAQIQQYLVQALNVAAVSPTALPPAGSAQTFYNSADASSVGDPHEAFNGTSGAGNAVSGKWDSMNSHQDLLDSDSFEGGYRVSTQATQPNASGVTLNQNATVTTAGGNTTVSFNAAGHYAVRSSGQSLSLQPGQTVDLGNGESVTLNADNSLTVNDRNGQGGSVTTTLAANGAGGVDVNAHAEHVDLGGYLVNRSDAAAAWPGNQPPPSTVQTAGFAPQLATLPPRADQFAPAAGSFGSWSGEDPLLAEQNVDPLLAG